jgi:hypothetical protein
MPASNRYELGQMSSTESFLMTMRAEREIYKTFCSYFSLLDNDQQYARIASECFTPDAEITYAMLDGPPVIFRGRDELTAYQTKLSGPTMQMHVHVVGQVLIEWVNSQPKLSAHVTAWHWLVANAHLGKLRSADWTTIGIVEDHFEQCESKWLICRRAVRPIAGLVATGSLPPGLSK